MARDSSTDGIVVIGYNMEDLLNLTQPYCELGVLLTPVKDSEGAMVHSAYKYENFYE